ncbi:MAG TPA: 30S ribosomal protein S20 [Myxococcaceae bacterium]|nr:30S ribosomal protein S20 [Myxococcaceae bacterium]
MANTKSAQKRNRQALKRRARNQAVRTQVKSAVKKAREALASKDAARVQEALRAAARMLDKAASKGVLHKKNASRRIARLAAAVQSARA